MRVATPPLTSLALPSSIQIPLLQPLAWTGAILPVLPDAIAEMVQVRSRAMPRRDALEVQLCRTHG